MDDKLNKAKDIAKEVTEKLQAGLKDAQAKKEAEAKGAAKDSKTEGDKSIVAEAEKQAEVNAKLLSSKDEELSEEDKTKKAELLKTKAEKEKKEETPDEKIKRTEEKTQKRIDEIIGELKAEREERKQDKEKIAILESELKDLKKPKVEEDKASKLKQLEEQQRAKYLEEDKSKPRESKREMTREELEEWLLEDYVSATEWLTDRNIRRRAERDQLSSALDDAPKKIADEFISKQQESAKKLFSKYPSLIPSPDKLGQLKGKSRDEIDEILSTENPEYAMMLEIVKSDPKRFIESADGPEQVMFEMDRRKSYKKTITLTEDELQAKIKEAAQVEAQRLAGLDEGISSTGGGRKLNVQEKKSEMRLKQEEIARKAGIPIEKLDARIKERERMNIPYSIGAGEFKEE